MTSLVRKYGPLAAAATVVTGTAVFGALELVPPKTATLPDPLPQVVAQHELFQAVEERGQEVRNIAAQLRGMANPEGATKQGGL